MTLPHPSLTDNLTLGRGNLLPPDDVQSSIDRLRRFEDSYLSLPVERDCLEYETERLAAAPKPHQKYFKEVPPRNLVAKTLSTMELLEIILLHADAPDVLQLQGVAKRWQAVMGGSWSLQRAIFRSPIPDTGQKFAKLNPLLFNRDNDSRHLVLSIGQKTSAPNASVFTDDDNRKHLLFQVNTSNTHATEIGHPSDQSLPTSLARTLKHPHTVKRRSGIELRISTFLKNLPTDSTSRDRQVLTIPGFDIVPMPASGSWKDMYFTRPPRPSTGTTPKPANTTSKAALPSTSTGGPNPGSEGTQSRPRT